MLQNWFKPMLYKNPVLGYNHTLWYANHIWLHKQPLFLWQMALSQYFLGSTEFAIRFPDVILHTLLTVFVYDIGKQIKNEELGYLAAIFFTFLNYPLELLSGKMGLDHNDFAFMFYITASFWAYFKYRKDASKKWLLFIALFAGAAVLVKWLPGLLVYLCWFLTLLFDPKKPKLNKTKLIPLVLSMALAFLVFMPWQVYCYRVFPDEYKEVMLHNGLHIFTVLEGHTGDWTFYFTELSKLYGDGDLVPVLLISAFIFFVFDKKMERTNKAILVFAILFVYTFFTLVKTKMTAFPVIVLPLVLIVFANFILEGILLIKNKLAYKIVFSACALGISFLFLNYNLVTKSHSLVNDSSTTTKTLQSPVLQAKKIKEINFLLEPNTVLFNCGDVSVMFMFYDSKLAAAYGFVPGKEQVAAVKQKGYNVAVIRRNSLPDYIADDPEIRKINCGLNLNN